MPYDRKRFFDAVRLSLFGGRLSASQVSGMDVILSAAPADLPIKHLAYALATAKHETAHTMQPIEEYGRGAGRTYGKADSLTGKTYYGRGFVQLTWKANYQRAQDELGVAFVMKPELALDPDLAAKIMFRGMKEGWFTGKRLSHYFTAATSDPVNARRIINGTDRAASIAELYRKFLDALLAAEIAPGIPVTTIVKPAPPDPPPMPDPTTITPSPTAPQPAPSAGFFARLGRWLSKAA